MHFRIDWFFRNENPGLTFATDFLNARLFIIYGYDRFYVLRILMCLKKKILLITARV